MGTIKQMNGLTFGKLKVIRMAAMSESRAAEWWCECECGNKKVVSGVNLRNGKVKSCGCLYKEAQVKFNASEKKKSQDHFKFHAIRTRGPK